MHLHAAHPFLSTGARVWPLFQFYTSFLQSWNFRPLGLSNCCACQQKWMVDEIAKNHKFLTTSFYKHWIVWCGIAAFVNSRARFGHDSFWIAFVIEIVIAFVMPTLAQINFTIASTTQFVPLSLCMHMHRSTLVYIYIYTYLF